ncbi:MAG TPA: hypothetical protein VGC40_00815 [Paenirhodobacter sp.]
MRSQQALTQSLVSVLRMAKVNRYLEDKAMDHIDHAIGRPVDPMDESYRNCFAVGEGPQADAFRSSPFWKYDGKHGSLLYFSVTDKGRRALRDHLRAIADPHRAYDVTFGGYTTTVVGTSPANAKYQHWLIVSDVAPDLTFGDYQRRARARLARPAPSRDGKEG